MAQDEDDDLYDEEFDFVDEDDDESPLDEPSPTEAEERGSEGDAETPDEGEEEAVDEYGRPEPAANYLVHIYEHNNFKRTIDRPFTPEDADAFATEYNRTGKSYGRVAVSGKNDAKPKKTLD
jgi:hypothetical protein